MPANAHGIGIADVHRTIQLLIENLVNIKDTSGKFLLKLDDGRVIDTKGWNDWEWTQGIGLYGMWKYVQMTDNGAVLVIIKDWFQYRFNDGTPTKNINTMAVILTLAHIYERDKNPVFLPYMETWADWAMNDLHRTQYGGMQHVTYNALNEGQLWDDTLMMTVLPLAKIGKLLNRQEYVEEAKYQFLLHIKYLFDPTTGLFFHGWTFEGHHHFAGARWARGNSWVTIVIPEMIELLDLPPNDSFRRHLVETLHAQVTALTKNQDAESGLFHTVLDDHGSASYLESSATAGFAYGIMKAVRKRYISSEYKPVALNAIRGLLANIDASGELQRTSFGTGMGETKEFYFDIAQTSMPYGQAMAMMGLVEFLHEFL